MIELPWPPNQLSPNNRAKHLHLTGVRNAYKSACFYAAKAAGDKISGNALLCITFHPPDNRKRDLDNMLSAIKYGLDGVALASGVDDYGWSLSIRRGEKIKGGLVKIETKEADDWSA